MNGLLTLLFIGLLSQTYAQEQITTNTAVVYEINSTDWIFYVDEEKFSIDYQLANCDPEMGYDKEMVLLRLTNKTEDLISVSWVTQLYTSKDECRNCEARDEYHFTVNLNPGESVEGNCSIYTDNKLKIFSRFNDENYTKGDRLYSFKLENLSSKSVQID